VTVKRGDQLGMPPTAVGGWLQRAVAINQTVWQSATRRRYVIDPNVDPPRPAGTALQKMLDAVGLAWRPWLRQCTLTTASSGLWGWR
jgi:hypothetical protein